MSRLPRAKCPKISKAIHQQAFRRRFSEGDKGTMEEEQGNLLHLLKTLHLLGLLLL